MSLNLAAPVPQKGHLRFGLHAFRNHLELQAECHADDGGGDAHRYCQGLIGIVFRGLSCNTTLVVQRMLVALTNSEVTAPTNWNLRQRTVKEPVSWPLDDVMKYFTGPKVATETGEHAAGVWVSPRQRSTNCRRGLNCIWLSADGCADKPARDVRLRDPREKADARC